MKGDPESQVSREEDNNWIIGGEEASFYGVPELEVEEDRFVTDIIYNPEEVEPVVEEVNEYLKEQFPKTFDATERCYRAAVEGGAYTEKELEDRYIEVLRSELNSTKTLDEEVERNYRGAISELTKPENDIWDVEIYSVFKRKEFPFFHGCDGRGGSGKERGDSLIALATFLGDDGLIEPGNPVEQIREALHGKKILNLGADSGSFTQILEHFGCETLGIEYDERMVKAARTGILSEDGEPYESVIQGDVWDLMLPESDLSERIDDDYDAIFSRLLFNEGSGVFEVPFEKKTELYESVPEYEREAFSIPEVETREVGGETKKYIQTNRSGIRLTNITHLFIAKTTERYLKEEGISLHLDIDSHCITAPKEILEKGFLAHLRGGVDINLGFSKSLDALPELTE